MTKTFKFVPLGVGVIAVMLPESAFNPLAILYPYLHNTFFHCSGYTIWVIKGAYYFVQTVSIFFLWQAFIPLGIFSLDATLIYGIVSLGRSVQLCKR